jgi:hypothetical protein
MSESSSKPVADRGGSGVEMSRAGAALQIVCAWCRQHLEWLPVAPTLPFLRSYSICASCYAIVAQDLTLHVGGTRPRQLCPPRTLCNSQYLRAFSLELCALAHEACDSAAESTRRAADAYQRARALLMDRLR